MGCCITGCRSRCRRRGCALQGCSNDRLESSHSRVTEITGCHHCGIRCYCHHGAISFVHDETTDTTSEQEATLADDRFQGFQDFHGPQDFRESGHS